MPTLNSFCGTTKETAVSNLSQTFKTQRGNGKTTNTLKDVCFDLTKDWNIELKLHQSPLWQSLKQSQEDRHSQKWRRAKPGGHRLDGLPFLILDEAQEVVLGARSLVLSENAVFTAASITESLSLTVWCDDKDSRRAVTTIMNWVRAIAKVEWQLKQENRQKRRQAHQATAKYSLEEVNTFQMKTCLTCITLLVTLIKMAHERQKKKKKLI